MKITGIILLLIVVVLIILSVSLNTMIKTGVETIGPTITGTDVTLEKVDLSLFSGQGQLEKLVVHNPPGFHTEHAFNLKTIHVKVDLESALSDTVVIKEILIDSPEISFEGTLSGSNISKIYENVKAFAGSIGGTDEDGGGSPEQTSSEKKIQIDQFILENAKVTLSTPYLKGQQVTILLPVVHLRDIGKQTGGGHTQRNLTAGFFSDSKSY